MFFEEKKLGIESITDLLQCGVSTVEPYALMVAPVYVFMKLNQKLVSVKAPLDFFTPEELGHLRRYETFYIPKSAQDGSRFQTSAKLIRSLIKPVPDDGKLSPSIYELSNEVLIALFPLWGRELRIDPFFTALFADELCGSFKPEKMLLAREIAIVRHDTGILLAGLITFVLLHLGCLDMAMIKKIRATVYDAVVDRDEDWEDARLEWQIVARDLKTLVIQNANLDREFLKTCSSEWAKKMNGRLNRIQGSASLRNYESLDAPENKELENKEEAA